MTPQTAAAQIKSLLGLGTEPVALGFRATPPAGVPRIDKAAASGCTYWKQAAEGRTFYTEAADHYGCPIGSHTHGIDLPPPQANELQQVVKTMLDLGYLRSEEVPGIPRLPGPFGVAVYAPLAMATLEPDVVLVRGNARQVMLLGEAASAAGVGAASGMMGRPTCAAIPEALRTQQGVGSLGCIGNRVYTGLADDELYFALPGKHVGAVAEKLAIIVQANRTLEEYHHARQKAVASQAK
jgi:uncharacterized protein (DUF169 family)